MSSYEKVYNVWKDLNESYDRMGRKGNRLDFVRNLLMYSKGEAAFRGLLKRINDDPGDASPEQVEDLCSRLQIARDNVAYCEKNKITDINLLDFTCKRMCTKFNLWDYAIHNKRQIIHVEEQFSSGSVIPLTQYVDGKFVKKAVAEYVQVCEEQSDFIQYVTTLAKIPEGQDTLRVLRYFAKKKQLVMPLIITSNSVLNIMRASNFVCSEIIETYNCEDTGITADLLYVTDNYTKVTVLGID